MFNNKKGVTYWAIGLIAVVATVLIYTMVQSDLFDNFTNIIYRETDIKVRLDDDADPYKVQEAAGKCPCDNDGADKYYNFKDRVLDRSRTRNHLSAVINMDLLEEEAAADEAQPRISVSDYNLLVDNFHSNNLQNVPFTSIEFLSTSGKDLCYEATPAECTPKQFTIEFLENVKGEPLASCETPAKVCTQLYYAELERLQEEDAGILT